MVLDDGCNPRPVRRQFFAQPVVPQESDSTVGGGYDGYDPFVTPTKVKVNVFSIVFNLTPPVFKRKKQPWIRKKTCFGTDTHMENFGGMWGWFFGGLLEDILFFLQEEIPDGAASG